MKWILYTIIVAITVAFAPHGTDVGKLQPIEIIKVSKENNLVMIETDTGDSGKGVTFPQALQNMKEMSTGIVIAETAEYLLLEQGAEAYLEEIKHELKGNVKVCRIQGEADYVSVSEYLNIHSPKETLERVNAHEIEEILVIEDSGKGNEKKIKIMLDK